MMSLRQTLFAAVPAIILWRTLSSSPTMIRTVGTVGGGVAGYLTSNILERMGR